MDPRLLTLTLPSLLVLGLLVAHSLRALPRRRALAFWTAVAGYGVARGAAVVWITRSGLGAPAPYVIHDPLFAVLGVPLQEVAGWAIVAYLGWWLGCRLGDRLFAQIAWACLFLGAVSWAVETAAVAAGWWHWTVPLSGRLLGGAPWIGLVDWFFVGTDFVLPFAVLTAPALAGRPARWLALAAFPAHFAAHLAPGRIAPWFPVPGHHLAHWLLLGIVLWLALRSRVEDRPFAAAPAGAWRWLPAVALAVVLIDAAAVQALLAGRPELLPSVLPAAAVALAALRPAWATALALAALALALWRPPLALAAVPAAAGGLLRAGRRRRWAAPAAVTALAALALAGHARAAARERELVRRLDEALAARDRGDLDRARDELAALGRDFPASAVPLQALGEIHYKTGRPEAARPLFERAVAIEQSLAEGYRFLAVIDLRAGRRESAAATAERGLAVAAGDPELTYLAARAGGGDLGRVLAAASERDPETARGLAALAFEVGDAEGAAAILDRAIARWPGDQDLAAGRRRLESARSGTAAPPRTP